MEKWLQIPGEEPKCYTSPECAKYAIEQRGAKEVKEPKADKPKAKEDKS